MPPKTASTGEGALRPAFRNASQVSAELLAATGLPVAASTASRIPEQRSALYNIQIEPAERDGSGSSTVRGRVSAMAARLAGARSRAIGMRLEQTSTPGSGRKCRISSSITVSFAGKMRPIAAGLSVLIRHVGISTAASSAALMAAKVNRRKRCFVMD